MLQLDCRTVRPFPASTIIFVNLKNYKRNTYVCKTNGNWCESSIQNKAGPGNNTYKGVDIYIECIQRGILDHRFIVKYIKSIHAIEIQYNFEVPNTRHQDVCIIREIQLSNQKAKYYITLICFIMYQRLHRVNNVQLINKYLEKLASIRNTNHNPSYKQLVCIYTSNNVPKKPMFIKCISTIKYNKNTWRLSRYISKRSMSAYRKYKVLKSPYCHWCTSCIAEKNISIRRKTIHALLLQQNIESNPGPKNEDIKPNLTLRTFNCNGLGNNMKMRRIFTKLKKEVHQFFNKMSLK